MAFKVYTLFYFKKGEYGVVRKFDPPYFFCRGLKVKVLSILYLYVKPKK